MSIFNRLRRTLQRLIDQWRGKDDAEDEIVVPQFPQVWNNKAVKPAPMDCAGAPKAWNDSWREGTHYRRWWIDPDTKKGETLGSWRIRFVGGGHGLWKPVEHNRDGSVHSDSRVWVVKGLRPSQIKWAGEVVGPHGPGYEVVRYFNWASSKTGEVGSGQPIDGKSPKPLDNAGFVYLHDKQSEGIKFRRARTTRNGSRFVVMGIDDQVLAHLQPYEFDNLTRQTGVGF